MTKFLRVVCLLLLAVAARASEVDPYTYAYIPLADSAAAVNDRINHFIATTVGDVNQTISQRDGGPTSMSDTEVEFLFFNRFQERYIIDVAFGIFEKCVASNDCEGWRAFERIQMRPEEGIFHAADWRYIPSHLYLAPVVKVCGVRMGSDKIAHFFSDAFRYFNSSRSGQLGYDFDELKRLSLIFERNYKGTQVTGVVSHADVVANMEGVRFYHNIFSGHEPYVRRTSDGLLKVSRQMDVCQYVTPAFDERILPSEYVYHGRDSEKARERREKLLSEIEARQQHAQLMAASMSAAELERARREILARRFREPRWQEDLSKFRLVWHGMKLLFLALVKPDFRKVALLYKRDYFKAGRLEDRKPITIRDSRQTASRTDEEPNTVERTN